MNLRILKADTYSKVSFPVFPANQGELYILVNEFLSRKTPAGFGFFQ